MRGNHFFLKRALFAALLLTAASAAAQSADSESGPEAMKGKVLKARIAQLDGVIHRLDLQINRLTWETYLDYAEQARITPKVFSLPGLNYARLRDTVPAIDTLGKRLRAASDAYTAVLRTDPQYEAIHQEYVAIRGVNDREREAVNKMQYNQMYARLRANNPDYEPALERKREAERQRKAAAAKKLQKKVNPVKVGRQRRRAAAKAEREKRDQYFHDEAVKAAIARRQQMQRRDESDT